MQHLHHIRGGDSGPNHVARWERLEYTSDPTQRGAGDERPATQERRQVRVTAFASWIRRTAPDSGRG